MAATLDNLKIGRTTTQPTDNVGTKDAVHTAIILLKHGESYEYPYMLYPGQKIRIHAGYYGVPPTTNEDWHAVVDPFLLNSVSPGEYFWAFLRPELMEGVKLRHQFDLPVEFGIDDALLDEEDDGCQGCYN